MLASAASQPSASMHALPASRGGCFTLCAWGAALVARARGPAPVSQTAQMKCACASIVSAGHPGRSDVASRARLCDFHRHRARQPDCRTTTCAVCRHRVDNVSTTYTTTYVGFVRDCDVTLRSVPLCSRDRRRSHAWSHGTRRRWEIIHVGAATTRRSRAYSADTVDRRRIQFRGSPSGAGRAR